MQTTADEGGYRIWGVDKTVYGPVELPVLISWIREERVLADTWILVEATGNWVKASAAPELQMFFRRPVGAEASAAVSADLPSPALRPGSLRRIKLLSDLTDLQLTKIARVLEPVEVRQWTELLRQGQAGDCMYFIVGGELRVRLMIGGKESVLATLATGEFFGEMALFDDGPRSADVIANQDSSLLKFHASSLRTLREQAPDVAADFLAAVGRSLAARIRADNKRFRDSVTFARA